MRPAVAKGMKKFSKKKKKGTQATLLPPIFE